MSILFIEQVVLLENMCLVSGFMHQALLNTPEFTLYLISSSLLRTMIEMLGDAYNALSQVILHTPVLPFLWTAHCILMCRAVRAVTGE